MSSFTHKKSFKSLPGQESFAFCALVVQCFLSFNLALKAYLDKSPSLSVLLSSNVFEASTSTESCKLQIKLFLLKEVTDLYLKVKTDRW